MSAYAILSCIVLNFSFDVQSAAAKSESNAPWWKSAVFYEVYPRSFADAKNTGTGNLAGITSKLDYLQELGVDAIWITPCYPSPQVDFGYDISDYCNIAPEYGTLEDFDKLVAEAKKRDIKILMDFVMNHTSDKHPWFVESASSKNSPKRDWYIWRDGKNGEVPNNWQSIFGHSAWKLDPKTNQYYYHIFYTEQPDLNWRNKEVRKAMYDVARFWLDRGVAGFRMDAVGVLFEDPALKDNPLIKDGKPNAYGDPAMQNKYNDNLPEIHEVFRELRSVLDSYPNNPVLIGETTVKTEAEIKNLYGEKHDEIQLPMNFFFAYLNKLSAPDFRKRIEEAEKMSISDWPLYFFSNHDERRHYDRYGDNKHNDQIAKLTAALLLTLRGSPILYYGEELGMKNNDPKSIEEVKDPIGKLGWPNFKGRDGERTPMQWNACKNAGFSDVDPWLPVPPSYVNCNVESERKDPDSILNFYKTLIKLRRDNGALSQGQLKLLDQDPHVLSYVRHTKKQEILICLNMSSEKQEFDLTKISQKSSLKTLFTTMKDDQSHELSSKLVLEPFAVYLGEIPK
ncbi:MAG: alpha-glucosidase [Cyanobacteria bacterium TGS_CYA1]|nr:alpha-glucosidase [Cyanobacteria bacterium TGS_CYA1]